MVDSYFLMDAMEGVYEEDLLLVQGFLGLLDQRSYRRRSVRKVWKTVLIAAILTLLLAACGYENGKLMDALIQGALARGV